MLFSGRAGCRYLCPVVGIGWWTRVKEAGHPVGVLGATAVAVAGVPVQRNTTEVAAYPFVFLLAPLINANLLLTEDVLQTIAMVWHAAITVAGDELTGEVRAVGTAANARLTGSALCYLATLKRYLGASFMQAALTGHLFYGHIQLFTKALQDSLCVFPFRIMPDAVYGAGTAIYSTDAGQMCTFHS